MGEQNANRVTTTPEKYTLNKSEKTRNQGRRKGKRKEKKIEKCD